MKKSKIEYDNQEHEIWKAVKGYDKSYMVSTLGRVKSLERYVMRKGGGSIKVRERVLKERYAPNGYASVILYKNGTPKKYSIHRLVAIAFIDNPKNKPYVNHKDGNKVNNCVSNIEWCTQYENMRHASKNGLLSAPSGRRHYKNKKVLQINPNGEIINEYYSVKNASDETGINEGNISNCARGVVNSAGGYTWKYL